MTKQNLSLLFTISLFFYLIKKIYCFGDGSVDLSTEEQPDGFKFTFKRFNLPQDLSPYYKGITFVSDRYCPNVTFGSEKALYALKQLHSTGANWVAIVVTEYQNQTSSNKINPVKEKIYLDYYTHISSTISDLKFIINAAHTLGLRVMLKPHIDVYADRNTGIWRGNIQPQDSKVWFQSYKNMIIKYATLAQALEVELFSIQCELIGVNSYPDNWKNLIKDIRYVFKGNLTSSANYGGQEISTQFWSELDFIGIDAYYEGWVYQDSLTVEELVNKWKGHFDFMKNLSVQQDNKKVIITELGFCSGDCSRNNTPSQLNLESQANVYEAILKLVEENSDWVAGIFWWSWFSDPGLGGPNDACITPHDKPAEDILRKYFGGDRPRLSSDNFTRECPCTL